MKVETSSQKAFVALLGLVENLSVYDKQRELRYVAEKRGDLVLSAKNLADAGAAFEFLKCLHRSKDELQTDLLLVLVLRASIIEKEELGKCHRILDMAQESIVARCDVLCQHGFLASDRDAMANLLEKCFTANSKVDLQSAYEHFVKGE